jgi:predicted nuclease of restriction endonuclease-like RecB superfamily
MIKEKDRKNFIEDLQKDFENRIYTEDNVVIIQGDFKRDFLELLKKYNPEYLKKMFEDTDIEITEEVTPYHFMRKNE